MNTYSVSSTIPFSFNPPNISSKCIVSYTFFSEQKALMHPTSFWNECSKLGFSYALYPLSFSVISLSYCFLQEVSSHSQPHLYRTPTVSWSNRMVLDQISCLKDTLSQIMVSHAFQGLLVSTCCSGVIWISYGSSCWITVVYSQQARNSSFSSAFHQGKK